MMVDVPRVYLVKGLVLWIWVAINNYNSYLELALAKKPVLLSEPDHSISQPLQVKRRKPFNDQVFENESCSGVKTT